MKISLSYFTATRDQDHSSSAYDVMLDSARLADEAGLDAVWLPERHFGDFGSPYPNPSVVAAAVATTTRRIGIRAGSVVLPLHHPVRVAEEWAVVDQLSRGRAGISFASGWHGGDFILARSDINDRRRVMREGIDVVRALWRGESRCFLDPSGREVEVLTRPRPVQPELPTWITSGGSTSTFELAASLRAGVLTHLVGQSPDQLQQNIAAYRAAQEEHADQHGRVTLMVHTHVLDGSRRSAERAKSELTRYLNSSMKLDESNIAQPKAADAARSLSADDREAVASLGVSRLLKNSLVCTMDEVRERLEIMSSWGVDEIACLIDFGFDYSSIMKSLDDLFTSLT